MDFHLLTDVRQTDGSKLGELRHVICDIDRNTVISLVAQQTGMGGRAVIVPVEAVDTADDDAVYVRLSPEEFDNLERYAFGRNVAPPPADVEDADTVSADYQEEPVDIPDVPPVGAAAGITSIAFTPVVEVQRNIPENSLVLDDGIVVEATDGDLGHLTHVLADDQSLRVSGFRIAKGFFLTRDVEVPMKWVTSVEPGKVTLSASKRMVETGDEQ